MEKFEEPDSGPFPKMPTTFGEAVEEYKRHRYYAMDSRFDVEDEIPYPAVTTGEKRTKEEMRRIDFYQSLADLGVTALEDYSRFTKRALIASIIMGSMGLLFTLGTLFATGFYAWTYWDVTRHPKHESSQPAQPPPSPALPGRK